MIEYIYGIHEPWFDGVELDFLFHPEGVRAWIVFTHEIGADPGIMTGYDYRPWADKGYGIIARLNHGYGDVGTYPHGTYYNDFAQRFSNFVQMSEGCRNWIVGNEPNTSREWPEGVPITAQDTGLVYSLCCSLVHGHKDDRVLLPAIGPWNVESGDWLIYFQEMIAEADALGGVDGMALHTYTHGTDPALITSMATMDPPFNERLFEFRAYRDFMAAIPAKHRELPVYITETDQNETWLDTNNGWVQEAYREIDAWNQTSGVQQIHCLALYRWPRYDEYFIVGKTQVHEMIREAAQEGYVWKERDVNGMVEVFRTGMEQSDGGHYAWHGINELTCPFGSVPVWNEDKDHQVHRPEIKPKVRPMPEVYAGDMATGMQTRHAMHDCALVWQVDVQPGAVISASVWAMGVSNDDEGGDGGLGMQIGVDPTGQDAHDASTVAYGEWWSVDHEEWEERKWYQIWSGDVVAEGSVVTIFLKSFCRHAADINASHFDELVVLSSEDPDPPGGDAEKLRKHADELDMIAVDLRAIADRIGSACPPEALELARAIQEDATQLTTILE